MHQTLARLARRNLTPKQISAIMEVVETAILVELEACKHDAGNDRYYVAKSEILNLTKAVDGLANAFMGDENHGTYA